MNIYSAGLGDRLVEERRFPKAIIEHQELEKQWLFRLSASAQSIVEVGCMDGRLMEWTIKRGLSYLGLDVVERYIKLGKDRMREVNIAAAQMVRWNAERINELAGEQKYSQCFAKAFLFYPFNSFGNFHNIIRAIESLSKIRCHFLISSYTTDKKATKIRSEYYAACQYKNLKVTRDNRGVLFTSKEGLYCYAFEIDYLAPLFHKYGVKVSFERDGRLGLFIHGQCKPVKKSNR